MKYIWVMLLIACSTKSGDTIPPPIFLDAALHECLDTNTDIYNCGVCGNICSPTNSDNCLSGQCFCGNSTVCPDGTNCRRGACREPDLTGRNCEFDEECPAGLDCIIGHCTVVQCVPEVCDGVDNDCDGEIDNSGDMPLSQFCVGEMIIDPFMEDILSPCSFGVRACLNGSWTECLGDVPPTQETGLLACDGLDNDCDGCLDGQFNEERLCVGADPSNFDVVYVIDVSGSMDTYITATANATRAHATLFATSTYFRFALVKVGIAAYPYHEITQDLTDFTTFSGVLGGVSTLGSGGVEPQWDAIAELADNLSWRPDATRIIILFSDEAGQGSSYGETSMCDTFTHGEVLATFERSMYFSHFDDCGSTHILTSDATMMVSELERVISNPCD